MISVVIPTLNDEAHLAGALGSLVPAAVDGVVREVIVADGGSTDRTLDIADGAGAEILKTEAGRGAQLKAGAERARFSWLLFLNADTILDAGWDREASHHIERVETGRRRPSAAAFKFALDDEGVWPRTLESFAALRTSLLKLPYGDQGLLISRRLYDEVGGFGALPMMEDLDLIRRLGRSRVALLTTRAMKGPEQHRRDASFSRSARNQICLGLYLLGVPVSTIVSLSGAGHASDGEPVAHRSLR